MRCCCVCLLATILLAASHSSYAGTYHETEFFSFLPPTDPNWVPPFAILHPLGYDGSGGVIELSVCVPPGSEVMIEAVQAALDMWNALEPDTGNCRQCVLHEEPPPMTGRVQGVTGIVHELGHCAMGLGHINLTETGRSPTSASTGTCDVDSNGLCREATSFTNSVNATEVIHAPLMARGGKGDDHLNQCPSGLPTDGKEASRSDESRSSVSGDTLEREEFVRLLGIACPSPADCCPNVAPPVPIQVQEIAWYRISDNNPVVIDSTVIDKDTYSRSITNLPTSGSTYAASANRAVAESLGFPSTQSVMYTAIARDQRYLGLSADDVNMVKMGMTGADRDATALPDDNYTIVLTMVPSCTGADIRVELANDLINLPDTLGLCVSSRVESFPQPLVNRFHWSVANMPGFSSLIIQINPNFNWDFSVPLFLDGFESGDTSGWSGVVP